MPLELNAPAATRVIVLPAGTEYRAKAEAKSAAGLALTSVASQSVAAALSILPGQLTNAALAKFITDWYGTRYRFGGTNKSGIDCSAFVQKLYDHVFGVSLVRTAIEQARTSCSLCTTDELKEGDLVFFKTRGSQISHVGVYLMNRFFVHSASSKGVMISSLDDKYWKGRFAGAGRVL